MAVVIKLTELYYKEFHKRKDTVFSATEAIEVYKATQELQKNWPTCLNSGLIPPDVVKENGLYYVRFNFPPPQSIHLRICFGVQTLANSDIEIVALTCKTKQELAGGSKTGTQGWKQHIATVGKSRWNDYRQNKIKSWIIY